MKNFFLNLLKNRSGVSSTRLLNLIVGIVVIFILICCGFVMISETVKVSSITTDFFTGIAAIIGACGVVLGATGITKVLTDKYNNEN